MKRENLKCAFWAREFGLPNCYTGLPNGLNTSLTDSAISNKFHFLIENTYRKLPCRYLHSRNVFFGEIIAKTRVGIISK